MPDIHTVPTSQSISSFACMVSIVIGEPDKEEMRYVGLERGGCEMKLFALLQGDVTHHTVTDTS
jgi:hypothetical protein